MEGIIQCKLCGRPFVGNVGRICAGCSDDIERDYEKVRNYLYEYPNTKGISEINEKTGVKASIIQMLIKDGRIKITSGGAISCKICGRPVSSGRFCDDCKSTFVHEIMNTEKRQADSQEAAAGGTKKNGKYSGIHIVPIQVKQSKGR